MTVKKISHLAGVSQATVSRVINKNPRVAPHLAETVRKAMKKVGYSTFSAKTVGRPRKMVSGFDTGLVAVLIPDPQSGAMLTTLSSRLCLGIEHALRKHGLNLVIAALTDENRLPDCIKRHKVDGVIIRSTPLSIPNIPSVVTFEQTPAASPEQDVAAEDNSGIGITAARLLLERGHRHLALVIPEAGHPSFLIRSLFFRNYAQTNGATVTTFQTSLGGDLATLTKACLSHSPRPTGIFLTGHDHETLQLLRRLREHAPRRGKGYDLVCCHNDPTQVSVADPKTIVLDIRPEEIGHAAVELLVWRKHNPGAPFRKLTVTHRTILPGFLRQE